MDAGCYTAMVTPFQDSNLDLEGLEKLIAFQIENGITGILAVGTTGESPTLAWDEHHKVVEIIGNRTRNKCLCIAGAGSNNTREALTATEQAIHCGADAVLLVDPYYNGPSSLEIRREYLQTVAQAFPDIVIIPYVIPGRTGTQLLPEDLALCYQQFPNVNTVKEATGEFSNMRRTRTCCGPDYTILSGDDGLTYEMMTDPLIQAAGVISVMSNIAPKAVGDMVRMAKSGEFEKARQLSEDLSPLFNLVAFKTEEKTPFGNVMCKARNPLPIKTLMGILGLPAGFCRAPLGKLTRGGLEVVLDAARTVHRNNPDIFAPAARFFNIDIDMRLNTPSYWDGYCYNEY